MFKNKKFNIINDSFLKKINAHSYIFYTNDFFACKDDLNVLLKNIFNIDDLNKVASDYIIIEKTDKKNILKEDIVELKNFFKTKSYLNDKRVYLIEEVHKLNATSANMILKFLEEPEEGIIAFFITTNLDSVISTIRSRCQIVNIFYNLEKSNFSNGINILNDIVNDNKYEMLFKVRKMFEKYDRNELIYLFNDYLLTCYDDIENENNLVLVKRLNKAISMLSNNVNTDYVFDYLILEGSD